MAYSKTGFSSGYPAYLTAKGGSGAGDPHGDGQAKATTCSGGWECPWTCYQILIRKEAIYTGEDLTGQMTCVDTCLWASVRACSHSHAHYSSSATAHLCRTARVTTADQAPSTVCAVWVLTARTAGAVRQRHRHCYHPYPRRHHLLCHRVRLPLYPRLRPRPLLYPFPIWMKGCWNARIRSGGGQRSNAWRIPMIRAATGGS